MGGERAPPPQREAGGRPQGIVPLWYSCCRLRLPTLARVRDAMVLAHLLMAGLARRIDTDGGRHVLTVARIGRVKVQHWLLQAVGCAPAVRDDSRGFYHSLSGLADSLSFSVTQTHFLPPTNKNSHSHFVKTNPCFFVLL